MDMGGVLDSCRVSKDKIAEISQSHLTRPQGLTAIRDDPGEKVFKKGEVNGLPPHIIIPHTFSSRLAPNVALRGFGDGLARAILFGNFHHIFRLHPDRLERDIPHHPVEALPYSRQWGRKGHPFPNISTARYTNLRCKFHHRPAVYL